MSELGKKLGYLKGLMEGAQPCGDPVSAKLFTAMAELLEEMSQRVECLEDTLENLNDYVESIDDDLADLEGERSERFPFADEDDEDEYLHDLEESEDQLHLLGGNNDEPFDGETLAGAICPECGKMFFVSTNDPEDAQYCCPHCEKHIQPQPLTPENTPIAKPE